MPNLFFNNLFITDSTENSLFFTNPSIISVDTKWIVLVKGVTKKRTIPTTFLLRYES
jgi:hypothetical protein